MIPIQKDEYIKQKETEKQELLDKLKLGVKNVFTSEKYREFLKAYSKFHNYYSDIYFIPMLTFNSALN